MELAGATWPQVEATRARTVLAVPLGSLEQHGPHLPLDTDSRIAGAVAAGLAARCRGVTVAPTVPYGASGEHADFPGTLLLGHAVLSDLLVELVRSARPPLPAWCSSTHTAGTRRRWPRSTQLYGRR